MSAISFKDAVLTAKSTLRELFYDDPVGEIALEEIELLEEGDRKLWAVTLGFYRKRSVSTTTSGIMSLLQQEPVQVENRIYKKLLIDAETGMFDRMDIRIVK